jgi:CubicO group peptidase (beta-lactamase class C family)
MKTTIITMLIGISVLSACKKSTNEPDPVDPPPNQQDIAVVDNAVQNFMTTYSIPGVSIAVTRNDKLIYVKSYGKMSATDNAPVTNNSLFRIASVSKPITAIGIMKLLEANKLTLNAQVFGAAGILSQYQSSQLSYMTDITVNHLLHHTSGYWPNDGNDPMFQHADYNHDQLINWTLQTYAPVAARGTYKYSNFGYCVLGRIIEKLSGKTYEQFIKDEILTPCGVTDMTISGNTLAERKTNEVLYTGQAGGNPYIYNIRRMDSHGGWLATATDLARIIVRVDGVAAKPDILQSSTISTMTTKPSGSDYACGWQVNAANNWWHTGGLPGTATEIVRAGNGFSWVILCNSRNTTDAFNTAMDNLLWPAVLNTSTPWQDIDQF